jgi:hypothetical protein
MEPVSKVEEQGNRNDCNKGKIHLSVITLFVELLSVPFFPTIRPAPAIDKAKLIQLLRILFMGKGC